VLKNSDNKKQQVKAKNSRQIKNSTKQRQARGRKDYVLQQDKLKIAKMIADPCNSEIEPGQYGGTEGYMARFKTVHTQGETSTFGYFLINPYTYSVVVGGSPFSGLYFVPPSSSANIANSIANPMGTIATTSGLAITTAGDVFSNSSTSESTRTLAACVRAVYVGTTSNTQGRIAFLENIDPSLLLTKPNVDQMFALASKVQRIDLDPMEVTYRPDEVADSRFKPTGVGALSLGITASAATSITEEGRNLGPKWMGFAWNGVPTNQMIFETIRVLEWKPDVASGLANNNQASSGTGEPVLGSALRFLDNAVPGWSTTLMNVAKSGASMAARAALGGVGLPMANMGRSAPLRIMY